MRFATVRAEGRQLYGAVVEGGFVALSGDFPQWPSLREVIAAEIGLLLDQHISRAMLDAWSSPARADHRVPVVGLLAQVMLILLGLYLAGLSRWVLVLERAGGVLWQRLQPRLGRLLPIRDLRGALLAGGLWGWLPCGLVYSVLVMALASGSTHSGLMLMLAFGLGTLPNLLAMAWMAERLRDWARRLWVKRVAGLVVVAMGAWGLAGPLARWLR